MTATAVPNSFEAWVVRTQVELAALSDAAIREDWTAAENCLATLNEILADRPPGDPAAVAALLSAARQAVDDVQQRIRALRDAIGAEVRQLGLGRKAVKAYT